MTDEQTALVMIGAMYENGGNTTHRHLDGHPELAVYPFESQIGTRRSNDQWSSMFPAKYRWPSFDLTASPAEDFASIIDEETKVRARTPQVSKFRSWPFDLDDDERRARYVEIVTAGPRTRERSVLAFFRATFETWRNWAGSGSERFWVGYSPVIVIDAATILTELDDAHFVHVVRNPWSAYADTKRRPVPLSLTSYVQQWTINQYVADITRAQFPDRMHILRLEDLVDDSRTALAPLCSALGIDGTHQALSMPSWNSKGIDEVYPWGTIRQPTPEANLATAAELDSEERREVSRIAQPWIERFGYQDLW